MAREEILRRAEFAPILKTYWLISAAWVMTLSCVFAPLIPFWFMGLGQWWTNRQYEAVQAELTPRNLIVRRGVSTRVEKTIPLDKITDLSMTQGIIQRWFGVHQLVVETAGQSSPGGNVVLVGVVDAEAFRDGVLGQRDALEEQREQRVVTGPAADGSAGGGAFDEEAVALLREIRDLLKAQQNPS